MARVLKLTYGATSIDLLAGTLKVMAGGFSLSSSSEMVWDTLRLVGVTTDSALRTAIAQLDEFFEYAELYTSNNMESDPVWFYWQSDGESAKRGIVYAGALTITGDDFNSPLLGSGQVIIDVAILHDTDSENEYPATETRLNVSASGGAFAPNLGDGTRPARINELKISTASASGMRRFWVGIKPTRKGTAGFIGLWNAELGTNFVDATDVADATASGSSKVRVSFATDTTMLKRLTLRWGQVAAANYDDLIGSYLVLCRCKVDAATTEVALKLSQGWAGMATGETPVGITYISGDTTTDWYLHELGTIQVPPTGNRDNIASTGDEIANFFLVLGAERLSAAGYIDIDCFILIPIEHLLLIDGASVVSTGGELHAFSPNADSPYVLFKTAAGGLYGNVDFSFDNWVYPVGGGLIVVAAQAETVHNLSNTLNFDLTMSYRWRSYRV